MNPGIGATGELNIRRARPHEAEALSALARKSKSHWGYSAETIDTWRAQVSVSADAIASRPTFVAVLEDEIVGFYSLAPSGPHWSLEHLWVLPQYMGRGIGRALVAHALDIAAQGGAASVSVDGDSNAERFYLACGAERRGAVPAPIPGEPGRVRPQFTFRLRP